MGKSWLITTLAFNLLNSCRHPGAAKAGLESLRTFVGENLINQARRKRIQGRISYNHAVDRKSKLPNLEEHKTIQINWVDPDGNCQIPPTSFNTPPPRSKSDRKLNHESWSGDESIRRFCRYVQSNDDAGLSASFQALDRLKCWPEALDALKKGRRPNVEKGKKMLSLWNTYGLHSIPTQLRNDLPRLVDLLDYLLPPYTGPAMTLYRGELELRHTEETYGISWTPNEATARTFANRRLRVDGGVGVVLKVMATPEIIVVRVSDFFPWTLTLNEDEYIIDPRSVTGRVSVV